MAALHRHERLFRCAHIFGIEPGRLKAGDVIVPSLHNEKGNRHVEAQCAHVHGNHGRSDRVGAEMDAIDPIGHIACRIRRMAAEIFDHLGVRQV